MVDMTELVSSSPSSDDKSTPYITVRNDSSVQIAVGSNFEGERVTSFPANRVVISFDQCIESDVEVKACMCEKCKCFLH